MKKSWREAIDIVVRYCILVVVAVPNLFIFYAIFTPLTVYPVYWLLNILFDASLITSNIILVNNEVPLEIIKACVAGSAYYLLFMLNLFTPRISIKRRTHMILTAFLAFLLINILRIFILGIIAVNGSSPEIFDITHKFFWYSVSTILVVVIWFVQVKMFNIEYIPLYSDIKLLHKHASKTIKSK